MDDDGELPWNKIITIVFVVSAMIVLLLLVFFMFLMPVLRE
jgi:hypothetical protein